MKFWANLIFQIVQLYFKPCNNRLSIDIQKQFVRLCGICEYFDFCILHVELSSVFLRIERTAKVQSLSCKKHSDLLNGEANLPAQVFHLQTCLQHREPTLGFADDVVEHRYLRGVLALQIRDLRLVLPLHLVKLFAVTVLRSLNFLMEFVNVLLSVCHKLAQLSVVLLHLLQFSTAQKRTNL